MTEGSDQLMDGFNHTASVSDVRQVVAPEPVSVFGHYEVTGAVREATSNIPDSSAGIKSYFVV